jgi:L-lactate dehydrogenase complex protein LldG
VTTQEEFIGRIRAGLEGVDRRDVAIPNDWMPEIDDLEARFELELTAVHGTFHAAARSRAGETLRTILDSYDRPSVVLTREPEVPADAPAAVERAGGELLWWPEAGRDGCERAMVGVTGAQWAVAETGSVLISSAPPGGRAPSLLTRAHVAFVSLARLIPTVADLFVRIAEMGTLPSNLVVVTGPSKSADIENQLVRGVHAPGDMHVVLVDEDN